MFDLHSCTYFRFVACCDVGCDAGWLVKLVVVVVVGVWCVGRAGGGIPGYSPSVTRRHPGHPPTAHQTSF